MKYLVGGRQTGITTSLVLEASKSGATIVVPTEVNMNYIINKAKELGVSVDVCVIGDKSLRQKKKVILDNASVFLNKMLFENGFVGKIQTIGDSF